MPETIEDTAAVQSSTARDEIIAALQQECTELRSALCHAKQVAATVQADNVAAKRRAAYDRHMGWHPEFNPHETKKVLILVDADFGKKMAVPYSAFESAFARRVFRKLEYKLQKLSPVNDIAKRRELIAEAYEKIATTHATSFWRRLLSRFF